MSRSGSNVAKATSTPKNVRKSAAKSKAAKDLTMSTKSKAAKDLTTKSKPSKSAMKTSIDSTCKVWPVVHSYIKVHY